MTSSMCASYTNGSVQLVRRVDGTLPETPRATLAAAIDMTAPTQKGGEI